MKKYKEEMIAKAINENGGLRLNENMGSVRIFNSIPSSDAEISDIIAYLSFKPYSYILLDKSLRFNKDILEATINNFKELLVIARVDEKLCSDEKKLVAIRQDIEILLAAIEDLSKKYEKALCVVNKGNILK